MLLVVYGCVVKQATGERPQAEINSEELANAANQGFAW
jgi:hypothetical protein